MPRTPHLLAIQSHVVFGHAGNAAAVFPMQRIGINVWPLNTVQFSNHTQYGRWTGQVLPPEQIPALLDGIAGIGELGISLTPSADLPLTIDLGVQGYTGKHEGVTGSLMVKWEF